MVESNLEKAAWLTSHIFNNIDHSKHVYKGYELTWALYSLVHINFSIPYVRIEQILGGERNERIDSDLFSREELFAVQIYAQLHGIPRSGKAVSAWRKYLRGILVTIVSILQNMILSAYSAFSLLFIWLTGRRCVGVWTGDFYDPVTGGDFRLGNLYEELRKEDIPFVELIRKDAGGFLHCMQNLFRRRRLAIYYSAVAGMVNFFCSNRCNPIHMLKEDQLHRLVLDVFAREFGNIRAHIDFFEYIFKKINLSCLLAWEFSDRQAPLIFAAKNIKLPVIGFQHGASMRTYMAHEYMPEFVASRKIGPDWMGVWSEWWKGYFEKYSTLYNTIEVSGPTRRTTCSCSVAGRNSPLKIGNVLWISEPLVSPDDVIEFMGFLNENYNLFIKKRPSTNDIFYESLMRKYPDFASVKVLEGDIFSAFEDVDVIVGSHSTAVLDASQVGKPFLLVNTEKWGDYFQLKQYSTDCLIFVEDICQLQESFRNIEDGFYNEEIIFNLKVKFFGHSHNDGVLWLKEKIKNCII